jgi:hypothetical protein
MSFFLVSGFELLNLAAARSTWEHALGQCEAILAALPQRSDFDELLASVFRSETAGFASRAENLGLTLAGDGLGVVVELRSDAELQGARGAYAAQGPDGQERIYINADWLNGGASAEALLAVLLEEAGHAIDRRLNGDLDTAGDEGALFAARVLGLELGAAGLAALTAESDQAVLSLDGASVAVELSGVTAPVAGNSTAAIHYESRVLGVADFGFSDGADGNTLAAVQIVSLPKQGSLRLNGVAVTAGQEISLANLTAGRLQYVAPAAVNGSQPTGFFDTAANNPSFTFKVRDTGATNNLSSNTATLTLNFVDSDGDGIRNSYDIDDDNDGNPDAEEQRVPGSAQITPDSISFKYAQNTSGFASFHDAAAEYKTGSRNDPAFLFDGKLTTELRVHQSDIYEFALNRTIGPGASFELVEGSGSNDKKAAVIGTLGSTDLTGNTNNASGGGQGWKTLSARFGVTTLAQLEALFVSNGNQPVVSADGTAILLFAGPSNESESLTTSIAIDHFQIVGLETHGGWADLSLSSEVNRDLDTDGDGVPNHRDLDSDNDGISDLYEATGADSSHPAVLADSNRDGAISRQEAIDYLASSGAGTTVTGGVTAYAAPVTTGLGYQGTGSTFAVLNSNDGDGSAVKIKEVADRMVLDFGQDLAAGAKITISANIRATDRSLRVSQTNASGSSLTNTASYALTTGQSTSLYYTYTYTTNAATRYLDIDNQVGVSGEIRVSYVGWSFTGTGTIDPDSDRDGEWDFLESSYAPPVDSDRDGLADFLDLDSDADGIADAIEARSSMFVFPTDPSNSFYTVDANGILAGYRQSTPFFPTPINTDNSGETVLRGAGGPVAVAASNSVDINGTGTPNTIFQAVLVDDTHYARLNNTGDWLILDMGQALPRGTTVTLTARTANTGTRLVVAQNSDGTNTGTNSNPVTLAAFAATGTDTTYTYTTDAATRYLRFAISGTNANVDLDLVRFAYVATAPATPDYLDTDSDGDGKLDSSESGITRTGVDANKNGIDDGANVSYSLPGGSYGYTNGLINLRNNSDNVTSEVDYRSKDINAIFVSDVVVNEGSPFAVFTVSGPATGTTLAANTLVKLSLLATTASSGNATLGSDLGSQLQVLNGVNWVNYTAGSAVTVPLDGVLLVRVAISNDVPYEGPETFRLNVTYGGASQTSSTATGGLGTIVDDGTGAIWLADGVSSSPATAADLEQAGLVRDDDRRDVVIDSIEVNEGSTYGVFTLTGPVGAVLNLALQTTGSGTGHAILGTDTAADIDASVADNQTLQYSTNDGSSWTTYTWNGSSGNRPTVPASGVLHVRFAITNDTLYEERETLQLVATYTRWDGTANYPSTGTATIRDDGLGSYWIGNSATPASEEQLSAASVLLDDDTPINISNPVVNEASAWMVFDLEGQADGFFSLALQTTGSGAGHATPGVDHGTTMQYWSGSAWLTYSSGTIRFDSAGHAEVRIAVNPDTPGVLEGLETLKLVATSSSNVVSEGGIGTIADDGTGVIFNGNGEDVNAGLKPGDPGYTPLDDDTPPVAAANSYTTNEIPCSRATSSSMMPPPPIRSPASTAIARAARSASPRSTAPPSPAWLPAAIPPT